MKLSNRCVQPINGLQDFDTLINHFLGPVACQGGPFVPRTDLVEHDSGYTLRVELPGVAADAVSVEVAEDQLTISGEKAKAEYDETSTVHRRERVTGKFERQFKFPTQVDFEKITANSQDGVLMIEVPKAAEVLPRKIEIEVK